MLFRPSYWLKSVLSINEAFLRAHGIDALILDLDNTLSMHGNPAEEAGVSQWLEEMRALGIPMMVVSNNTKRRVAPLAAKLGLEFVSGGAKPLPFGIRRALRRLGVSPERAAVVGDQIFTDVAGGNLAHTKTILVEPFHLEKGILFRIKRGAEGIVFRRDFSKLK